MKPDARWRAAWLALNALGVVACYVGGLWIEYFALVAMLEAAALVRALAGRSGSGTFSWVVWAFLRDVRTRRDVWRVLVVAVWSMWFVVSFAGRGWFSPDLNAFAAMAFGVWLWAHFFTVQRRG